MPNIATILKAEITRVSRKEVRAEVDALRKSSSQHRTLLIALRRQVEALEKRMKRLHSGPANTASTAARGGVVQLSDNEPRRRFSASRLTAHRVKLGLSAARYGSLVGLSGQTIFNWEQGRSRPNADQVRKLAELKSLSKSAAGKLLAGREDPPA
ncbi:MAG: XRE family transcriptional regulator [Comamonadaceae bacterium]|nr:MAG: XRE family transcriptional regulator [Comamonadaceae bacterium]